MRRRFQRRRVSTFGLWFAVVVAVSAASAWQFGWIPLAIEFGHVSTGQLTSTPMETEDGHLTTGEGRGADFVAEPEQVPVDPIVFSGQSEPSQESSPPTESSHYADFAGRLHRNEPVAPPRRLQTDAWDEPPASTMPPSFPTVNSATPQPTTAPVALQSPPVQQQADVITRVSNEVVTETDANSTTQPPSATVSEQSTSAANPVTATTAQQPPRTLPQSQEKQAKPVQAQSSGPDLQKIDELMAAGEDIAAHRELSRIYWQQPEYRKLIQERIDTTARLIYFSPQPHYMEPYVIQPGDQLRKVAAKYHVSWEYLANLNRVDPRRIRSGQRLKVIQGPFSAFVDLSDFQLVVHSRGYYVRRYRIGVGKDGASPLGKFKVLEKVADPQYTDPDGKVIAGDDPQNPLGKYWIDIGNSFGIHGTIEPESIGKAESRGCIRMLDGDIDEVYTLLEPGSEVAIRR